MFLDFGNSNLFVKGEKLNWINIFGLGLRTAINLMIQTSIILGFKFATLAGMNQGVITSLFSMYCVFTSVISFFLFGESLKPKFVAGISMMIACVVLVSYPKGVSLGEAITGRNEDHTLAISFGLLAPTLISLYVAVSRYWTTMYGYASLDFTMDTFLLMGLIEIWGFWYFQISVGYTYEQLMIGTCAAIFQIVGTLLFMYASTFGLAGPTCAMVQFQSIVHTCLSALFLGILPSMPDLIGIFCALIGGAIMTVDANNFCTLNFRKKKRA